VSGGRFERALAAFLRQEFGSSVAAVLGFLDILVEDAERQDLEGFIPDLERMRLAAEQLSKLITETVVSPRGDDGDMARLRHELRTPLNAIKGYAELLVEEARDSGRDALLDDLGKVLDLANRLLGEIDRMIEVAAAPSDVVSHVLQTIRPLAEADISDPGAVASHILVVDDNASNRDLLSRRLARDGHRVTTAEDGGAALAALAAEVFDLVLLDLMMPGMSGFEVLCRLKADERCRHVPVIMISALDELDSTVRCIEAGAEDYLPKPFNPVLLRARINASLEKKRLRDREQAILAELRAEKERSEALLLNILPRQIVERMRRGETVIADHVAEATILFSDIVDFTSLSAELPADVIVALLGKVFSRFDALAAQRGLEKIKTIGDGYMVAGGVPEERYDHAAAVAAMALSMLDAIENIGHAAGRPLRLRVGLHTGPLIAGVIGTHKFVYDVWGDTVNTAKRMESYGAPGRIHISAATRQAVGDAFPCERRGLIEIKGKGPMETYFLCRRD
jgi:adenylate cyclase